MELGSTFHLIPPQYLLGRTGRRLQNRLPNGLEVPLNLTGGYSIRYSRSDEWVHSACPPEPLAAAPRFQRGASAFRALLSASDPFSTVMSPSLAYTRLFPPKKCETRFLGIGNCSFFDHGPWTLVILPSDLPGATGTYWDKNVKTTFPHPAIAFSADLARRLNTLLYGQIRPITAYYGYKNATV